MPVQVVWDDDAKTIIRQIYSGHVVLNDYYDAVDHFVELASSVDYTVHSIMDRRDILVSQASYLQVMRYGDKKIPDNVGLRVIINAMAITRMMVNIGERITPRLINNVHIVDTLEEARTTIESFKASSANGG